MRPPAPRSSLAKDQELLGGKWVTTPFFAGLNAGLTQVHVLKRLIMDLHIIDPSAPYSLLRSAVEAFARCAWLVDGQSRDMRRIRILRVWVTDQADRQGYDDEIGYEPVPPAKSGNERCKEIMALAESLGLCRIGISSDGENAGLPLCQDTLGNRVRATKTIPEVAAQMGYDGNKALASWRLASGFAHGRIWPALRASEVTGAERVPGGAEVRLVIDDAVLDELAMWCGRFLERAIHLYYLRGQVHL